MNDRPLNIAFIVDSFPALSETFILDQVTGMIERGHNVTVFAHARPPAGMPVHADVGKYRLMERVRYFDVPDGKVARVFSGMLIGAAGLIHHPSVVAGALNPRRFGRNALNLRMLYWTAPFLDERFDIIHAHYGTNGSIATDIRRLGISGCIVCQFHLYDIRMAAVDGGRRYNALMQYCDRLLAISDYSRLALLGFGASSEKIVMHPNGIDMAHYAVERHLLDRLPDPVRIVTVGRLVQVKGIAFALHAIRKLLDDNPAVAVQYRIAGGGPLRDELIALAHDLGIEQSVRFLGPLDRETVAAELREAHLYLLPSLAENLPTVLLEAHAAGLPVVAADVGAVSSIVEDSVSGYLVHPGDHLMLADRLAELFARPDRWKGMGEWGRDHVAAHFEIHRLNERLEQLYYELVASS